MAKIILAGGSGFLGQALAWRLAGAGQEVVVLSRSPRAGGPGRVVGWDAATVGDWTAELAGAAAIVNLVGRSINCVHTPAHRSEILRSRVDAVRALAAGCARIANPPPVWVQCSATGFYGDVGDQVCDEAQAAGAGFLAETCRAWEEAFHAAGLPGIRRVVLRLGVVLDAEHGALPPLVKLTRRFLGGAAGSGRQYFSWIHREDLLEIFQAALTRPEMSGTYNACAPGPVTNAALMSELRAVVGRPWCPPAPAFMVRFAARRFLATDPTLALEGQRAVPARLSAAGFAFGHPTMGGALRDLLAASRGSP